MRLLDADVLLIALRYLNDPKFAVDHQALQQLQADPAPVGVMAHTLLEVVGVLSFIVPAARVLLLPDRVCRQFNLTVLPDPQFHPEYGSCTTQEVLAQLREKMGLGDAVQAVQIARYASHAECLLTWNARHFVGKLAVPVFTPQEWLNQRAGPTP